MNDLHQPREFPENIIAAVSSRKNGNMRGSAGNPEAAEAMSKWLKSLGIDPRQAAGLLIEYGDDKTYDVIAEIDEVPGDGVLSPDGWITADALVTSKPDIALVLPTGDCNSPQVVDPENEVIALGHAGWHSTVHNLLGKLVVHLQENHQSNPAELLVHFPPSIRRKSYIFEYLLDEGAVGTDGKRRWHSPEYAHLREDGKYEIDLLQYNLDLLREAGVKPENITVADADTFTHEEYFSNHLRHHGDESARSLGRIATVIMRKS